MTIRLLSLAVLATAVFFGPTAAQAAGSCSGFAVIQSYDEAKGVATVKYVKGREASFFPRTEGSPPTSKIPKPCRGKVKKQTELVVTPTGGRMTVTQVRANFSGKMLNDTHDKGWVPSKINELIAAKETVVILVREGIGKDAPLGITTIYLPVTQEELDEIARLEAQVSDE